MLTNVTFLLTNVKKKTKNMCNSVLLKQLWYRYVTDSNLFKVETESELMTYCDFFKNVADTK